MQRKVRSRERQVMKKRSVGVLFGVLGQNINRVIGQRRRGVKVGSLFDRRQRDIVFPMPVRIKKSTLISQQVRVIKTVFNRHSINVPLARVVRPVAGWFQKFRSEHRPVRTNAPISAARRNARQRVATNLLSVVAGQ